jgi:hypothetical protein
MMIYKHYKADCEAKKSGTGGLMPEIRLNLQNRSDNMSKQKWERVERPKEATNAPLESSSHLLLCIRHTHTLTHIHTQTRTQPMNYKLTFRGFFAFDLLQGARIRA